MSPTPFPGQRRDTMSWTLEGHHVPDTGGTPFSGQRRNTVSRTPEGHLVPDTGGTPCPGYWKAIMFHGAHTKYSDGLQALENCNYIRPITDTWP